MAAPPTRGVPGAPRVPLTRPAASQPREARHNTEVGDDAEELAAYARKHAADLEEESRRNLSSESNAERTPSELEAQKRLRRKEWEFDERRRKRGRRGFADDDDQESREEAEAEAKAKALVAGGEAPASGAPPEDRMGDPLLTDPGEMQRTLGASARFAQHAMLLAEAKMKQGASRPDAVAFLAGLYAGLADRAYARKALRAFGPGTGILDLYPLEVMEHLIEHVPGFLDRAARAKLFRGTVSIEVRPGEAAVLDYDPALRIRGFAVAGGARPGYRFEPGAEGRYRLSIDTPGRFILLVSAVTKDGALLLDEVEAQVHPEAPSPPAYRRQDDLPSGHSEPTEPEADPKPNLPAGLGVLHFPRRI